MNILFYVKTKQNLHNIKLLGGIEILNYNLNNFFKKKNLTILTNKITNKIKDINWDVVISSNDATIFNYIKTKRKILWLHNKLQIEKSIRKKQFLSLIFNKIEAVFVSKYLENRTTHIYNFTKRIVIPNFLPNEFVKKKLVPNKLKKKKIIWSVKRSKGLDEVIDIWLKKIYPYHKDVEFHIFGINDIKYNKYNNKNIFLHGEVSRKKLISYYKNSLCMICLGYDETFCLNAIESFSMGLPIISLGKTALNEILINNFNGYKIESINDLPFIINKIINLDFFTRNIISENCFAFSKNFHFSRIKNLWLNLIKNHSAHKSL